MSSFWLKGQIFQLCRNVSEPASIAVMSSGSQPTEKKSLSTMVGEALKKNEDFDPAGFTEQNDVSSGMDQVKESAKWDSRANDLWHRMIDVDSDPTLFSRDELEYVLRGILEVGEAGAPGVQSANQILESLKESTPKALLDLIRHLTT